MASKTPAAFQVQQTRKRLDQFSVDLEAAINHATKFSPYRKTAVVAFHWDNDDIGVEPLEGELLGVFRFVFGFEIESFSIPVEDSQRMLLEYLVSWSRRHSADNTLRIFVYSGHAICPRTFASRWYLGGQFNPHTGGLKGPSVDWWAVQGYLEELKGDACYIFDCCYPQSGVLGAYDGPEFMAASVWDQAVTPSTNLSFTRILIDELRQLNGQSETLASIYSRVFSCAQLNQVGAVPVHIPKPNSPSVTIGRSRSRPPPVTRSSGQDTSYVLLSVQVQDEIPLDPTEWKKWLTRLFPANIVSAKVTIEGAFRGSNLLLFTVPVEVWTMMPANDSSYAFVGHVMSHNLTCYEI